MNAESIMLVVEGNRGNLEFLSQQHSRDDYPDAYRCWDGGA
jgi:hypothetical protein